MINSLASAVTIYNAPKHVVWRQIYNGKLMFDSTSETLVLNGEEGGVANL